MNEETRMTHDSLPVCTRMSAICVLYECRYIIII